MKTLISWIAYAEDFKNEGRDINTEGPHLMFYRHHFGALQDIYKHVLLYNSEEEHVFRRAIALEGKLRAETIRFDDRKITVSSQLLTLDPFDASAVFQQLDKYLVQSGDEQFVAMINTGTKEMHTVWHLLASRYPKKLELISVVDPQFSKDKEKGDIRINLKLEEDVLPSAFTLRQSPLAGPAFKDFQPEARKRAVSVAGSPDTTVLILGDHGTGKEGLAKTVHDNSTRKSGPYIIRNCAGYTDELLSSALFGHVKGAFTGAIKDQKGIFEEAKGGTVFLDEIGDISKFMQVSLLRVLQNKVVVPVGGSKEVKIDVRVIAATNKDLLKECEKGNFRWDLYYRLAVAEITTKPVSAYALGEKREMLDFFIDSFNSKFQSIGREKLALSSETRKVLEEYHFPGNIREVENLIESFYTYDVPEIKIGHIPSRITRSKDKSSELLKDVIKVHCNKIYEKYGRNQKKAMDMVGISHPDTFKKYREGGFTSGKKS